jgi:hypothetical protein
VSDHQATYPIATMCRVLGVSSSGYYAWRKRRLSRRAETDTALTAEIQVAHTASRGTLGRENHAAAGGPDSKHGVENEHVVRCAACIGVVRADLQRCAVIQQSIKNIRRFVAGCRYNTRTIRTVLIRDMCVKPEAGIVAVARIDLPRSIAALG